MPFALAVALALHVLATTIWVGGMFFAFVVLRPSTGSLDGPARLALWRQVFDRFLPWVWGAVVVLFGSGYFILGHVYGDFEIAGLHIHIMHGLAWVMAVLFAVLYFGPYAQLGRALDEDRNEDAAAALGRIRQIVAINLTLGMIVVVIGSSGPLWG